MEGSVAAPAAGGDAAQQQGDGGGEGQSQAAAFDPTAMAATLDGLATSQQEMYQFLASQPWSAQEQQQQQQQPAETVPPVDLSFLDAQSNAFDPEQAGKLLSDTIAEQVEARAKALVADQVGPVHAQLQEFTTQHEANQLATEFPELRDPETAKKAMQATNDLAVSVNRPELAGSLWLMRIVHMATQAADAAAKENGSQDPAAATLEGGAGARPGGGPGGLTAQQIVGGSQRGKLPFG